MFKRTHFKAALLAASAAMFLGAPTGFADDSGDFAQFAVAAETSAYAVEYAPIKNFTDAFGSEQRGRLKISYAAVEQQGKAFMASYKRYLAAVPVSTLSENDQLAYWLNTHNMLVIDAMANSKSRRRMSSQRGTPSEPGSMWTEKRITVEGVELSLHDIEQNIILANFADNPNVMFGLYQGTAGSPTFPAQGFTAANVQAELEAAGREYVNSRGNGVKASRSKARIPAVYDWYTPALFGGDEVAARAHLANLLDGSKASKFSAATHFEARKFSYSSDEHIIRQQTSQNAGNGGFSSGPGGGGGGGAGS